MVNYSYYSTVYCGDKVNDSRQFTRLSRKASKLIEKHTFGRSRVEVRENVVEDIKMTICELVDTLADLEQIGNVSSESNAEWSISYNDKSESQVVDSIIYNNLINTGLLYKGVY